MEGRKLEVEALAELLQEMREREALQDMVASGAENREKRIHEVSNITANKVTICTIVHTHMHVHTSVIFFTCIVPAPPYQRQEHVLLYIHV